MIIQLCIKLLSSILSILNKQYVDKASGYRSGFGIRHVTVATVVHIVARVHNYVLLIVDIDTICIVIIIIKKISIQ